mgnify:CR=1 FL=1
MAQQNLDFNIVAHTKGMEAIANLINRVGALETEIKKVQSANVGLASSTDSVIRNNTRYNNALDAQSKALRNARQGTQQLGMQVNDFATSVSTGASPLQAFNQQIGQVGYAMSMMGGRLGAVGAFLAGPWGAALTFATMGLGMLWSQTQKNEEAAKTYSDVLYDTSASYDAVVVAAAEYNQVMERENRTRIQTLHFQRANIAANLIEASSLMALSASRRQQAREMMSNRVLGAVTEGGNVTAFLEYDRQATAAQEAFVTLSQSLRNVDSEIAKLATTATTAGTTSVRELASAGREAAESLSQAQIAAAELFRRYEAGNISQLDFVNGARQVSEMHQEEERATRNQVQALIEYARAVDAAMSATTDLAGTMAAMLPQTGSYENFVLPESVVEQAIANGQTVRDAMRGFTDEMKTSFQSIGESVSSAFQGMITGAMGWKEAMRGIINSVIQQLMKLYVTQQIVGLVTSAMGSIGLPVPVPGKAVGGTVSSRTPYMVGEKGPELFIPGGNGTIIPNNNIGGGGGNSFNITVDARGSSDPAAVREQVQRGILEAAPAIVAAAEKRTIASLQRPRLGGVIQ